MDLIQLKLCDIQGRLFELSLQAGYDSEDFMKRFMRSKVARDLDSEYNRMQWAGEEYLLEEFADECPQTQKGNARYDREVMYWTGYLYRYWHILTNEPSREIYAQAPAKTMNTNYLMFHTMAPELAIEDLKELHQQKKQSKKQKSRKPEQQIYCRVKTAVCSRSVANRAYLTNHRSKNQKVVMHHTQGVWGSSP